MPLNNLSDSKGSDIRNAIGKNNGKAVLLSIKKEWLDKIASGEKTIELRKSMPSSIKFPFVVLCYETKADVADPLSTTNEFQRKSLVSIEEMDRYMGASKFLYGWYVSDYTPLDCNLEDLGVMRAPQSWQYIALDM